jgi:hypothetical protein
MSVWYFYVYLVFFVCLVFFVYLVFFNEHLVFL